MMENMYLRILFKTSCVNLATIQLRTIFTPIHLITHHSGRTFKITNCFRHSNTVAMYTKHDRLCGLVVRVLGYRSGGPGSIPGTTRKNVVGLERGPLSLVSTTEELLDRKVAAPVQKSENTAVGIRHADHVALSIRKSWQSLSRQAAVARSI
jgi:hypothetical protein